MKDMVNEKDIVDEDDLEPIFGGPRVVHNKWFSQNKGQFFVMIYGMFTDEHGIETFMNDFIPYAQYVLYKEKKRIVQPWEEIYYINGNKKDDRIENLKVIDIRPQSIEVKYPYDPKRYYGKNHWHSRDKKYEITLYLKKEYKNDKSLKRKISISLNKYIVETEKIKRFLKKGEKVIFKDKNKSNYNLDNLKIVKRGEEDYNKLYVGNTPFQDYYIGSKFKDKKGQISLILHPINKNKNKSISITYSKYKYELKLGRRLERNERLVYKDGNNLNNDIDNLTHKELGQAEHPFEDYYISNISTSRNDGRKSIYLSHKSNSDKNKYSILYSKYRMQVLTGRFLTKGEEVDHIDANPYNDSDDNLQILTKEEHIKKNAIDKKELTPKIAICCDGCNEEFEKLLSYMRVMLKYNNKKKLNNFFCSSECKQNYIRNGNKIQYKKLIKYICASTGKEIEIPENAKFLPSRFNPDALPFYDYYSVLKYLKRNYLNT